MQPSPAGFGDTGYQLAFPDSRAFSGEGCNVKFADAYYNTEGGYGMKAVYRPGEAYCLVWPAKNHAWLPEAGCDNQQSKSDAGVNGSLWLSIGPLNETDPTEEGTRAPASLNLSCISHAY